MIASVCTRKLRVVMYTGFGSPVDPEVKFTNPGHVRNGTAPLGVEGGCGPGITTVSRPSGAPAGARSRSDGGMNSGVSSGSGGDVRQARGSGG